MKLVTSLVMLGLVFADDVRVHVSNREPRQREDSRLLFNFLMAKPYHNQKPSRLGSYSFKNCGDPTKEELLVNQLTVSPDPVPSSGTITVTFSAQARAAVVSPVKASLLMKKDVFGAWIPVPCVDGFGSCTYDDFCQILSKSSSCPPPFIQNKVPCKCPIPIGNYTLPGISIKLNLAIIPPGGYSVKFDLEGATAPVGCYEVDFTLQ
ncbi:ganglioside GM2 activator-like [Littorina saxatilis]|uniref:MD-2-related lipid-recognition domain-containing protein n=1 Tax=Littorina saxatilis TaxID=31220 RepID=A0AAN9G4L8_9CAEN